MELEPNSDPCETPDASKRDGKSAAPGRGAAGAAAPNDGGAPKLSPAIAHATRSPEPDVALTRKDVFPIVGIGASAGGLAAIARFLDAMPAEAESRLAIVIVQHLDPDHKSMLSELLRQHTGMTAHEAEDGVAVQPGEIYVIPPNADLALLDGKLQLVEPVSPRALRLAIDFFLRSLANDRRDKAIGVILSGTGADGTLGLRAVKEAGGLVLVQQPETAQYDSMPRSALATGLVDYALPPEEMPARILAYIERAQESDFGNGDGAYSSTARPSELLQRVFALLRAHSRHDFSRYKRNTILRRIERRMAVRQLETMEEYVRFLQGENGEVDILFRELLIGVTNFFRDPEAFAALQARVFPALLASKRHGDAVRVWAPGCSTGEEAYSIAMLIHEQLSRSRAELRAQIFATDIDPEAIEQARQAIYPAGIAADVSPERLSRFFTQENGAYRVKKVIRDMVVFAEQNVAEDPPFSRMDLISCRNLLIYMNGELQRRVLPLFCYALNPLGYLFLGTSESVGEFADLFAPVDRKWKIFQRKPGLLPQRALSDLPRAGQHQEPATRRIRGESRREAALDMRQALEQALLAEHTPAAVVVNAVGDVLFIHGRTGYYLEPAPGEASLNVLRMARDGLRVELAAALRKAAAARQTITQLGLSIRFNGSSQVINLTVEPLATDGQATGLFLVVFEPAPAPVSPAEPPRSPMTGDKDERTTSLERELRSREEYIQTIVEELETSNEELTSTNEELQSANEELQSTNEELETSKEELQSLNEELLTVNAELQKKIDELAQANNDLNNLLTSTGIGTIFVDDRLRIQRFTPAASEVINLIQTDIGRPVSHLVSNIVDYADLAQDVTAVIETLIPREREVQARGGKWYLMRIQPYRTLENVIEGAVITFVDLTTRKRILAALEEAHQYRLENRSEPVIVFDLDGRVLDLSHAALELLGHRREEIVHLRASDLVEDDSLRPLLRGLALAERGDKPSAPLALLGKGGRRVLVEAHFARVEGGTIASIFVVLHEQEEGGRET